MFASKHAHQSSFAEGSTSSTKAWLRRQLRKYAKPGSLQGAGLRGRACLDGSPRSEDSSPNVKRSNQRVREETTRWGVVLLGLFTLAQVLSFVHLVAVPHVACQVHEDELVHGALHPEFSVQESRDSRSEGPIWGHSSESEKHGTHCGMFPLLRRGQPAPSAETRSPRIAFAFQRPWEPAYRIECERRFPLYLLAPKTSPPIAG
jgi:hypothetical protein